MQPVKKNHETKKWEFAEVRVDEKGDYEKNKIEDGVHISKFETTVKEEISVYKTPLDIRYESFKNSSRKLVSEITEDESINERSLGMMNYIDKALGNTDQDVPFTQVNIEKNRQTKHISEQDVIIEVPAEQEMTLSYIQTGNSIVLL